MRACLFPLCTASAGFQPMDGTVIQERLYQFRLYFFLQQFAAQANCVSPSRTASTICTALMPAVFSISSGLPPVGTYRAMASRVTLGCTPLFPPKTSRTGSVSRAAFRASDLQQQTGCCGTLCGRFHRFGVDRFYGVKVDDANNNPLCGKRVIRL